MKRILSSAICFLLIIGLFTNTYLAKANDTKKPEDSAAVLCSIPNDNSQNGLCLDINEQGNGGPASFAVLNPDDILILDSLNQRIQRYRYGAYSETIEIELRDAYQFLETDGENAYLIGQNHFAVIDLQDKTQLYIDYPVEELGTFVCSCSFSEGKLYLMTEKYGNYVFDPSDLTIAKTSLGYHAERVGGISGNTVNVKAANMNWSLEAADTMMDIIGFSPENELLVLALDLSLQRTAADYCTIRKYAAGGSVKASSSVDLSNCVFKPIHFVKTDGNGTVYVMESYEPYTVIYVMENSVLAPVRNEEIPPIPASPSAVSSDNQITVDVGTRSETHEPQTVTISRAAAQTKALNMKNYTWTFKTGHDAWDNNSTAPRYLLAQKNAGLMPCSETGIPYCWANFNTLTTVTDDAGNTHYSFAVGVNQVLSNGNMKCRTGNISTTQINNTIGTDCSGFVSGAYGFTNKVDSSRFYNNSVYFTTITRNDLTRMDYLVKSGHVLLFYQWISSTYGTFTTIECTTATNSAGERDKVLSRTLDLDTISGYIYRRPKAWANCTHTVVDATYSYDAIQHWKACKFCDAHCNVANHSFTLVGGVYRCTVCGYTTSNTGN